MTTKFTDYAQTTEGITSITAASIAGGCAPLNISVSNPTVNSDPNDRRAFNVAVTYDSTSASNPNFSDLNAAQISIFSWTGQNNYSAGTGASTTLAKKTFIPLLLSNYAIGAGQRFVETLSMSAFGMGDSCIKSFVHEFGGGPIAGDEGQGIDLVSSLRQQTYLVRLNVDGVPTQSGLNTTLAQVVTASRTAQTVSVASASGAAIGDWVVIGQQLPTGNIGLEAVKLTAVNVGGNTITGVFTCNHDTGTIVKPALMLRLSATFQTGEQRVLVNMSATPYTTGTVASISGGQFTGSGTTWTESMVGGDALNIGAISLESDNLTCEPFNGGNGPLRCWYQITGINSTTSLGIFRFSVAGDQAYSGNGVGTNHNYTIRPAARILRIDVSDPFIVACEYSTHAWTVNDTVECIICPYPDVSFFQHIIEGYTAGGTYRRYLYVDNRGAQTIDVGFELRGTNMRTGGGADTVAWGVGYYAENCNTAYSVSKAKIQAILLPTKFDTGGETDLGGKIQWGQASGPAYIMPDTDDGGGNYGIKFGYVLGGAPGYLQGVANNISGETLARLDNIGSFRSTGYITAYSGTVIPAGGTAGKGFLVSSTTGFGVFFGSGAPSLTAAKGSMYLRSDGSTTNDRAYVNTNGSATWTAIMTAA